MAINFSGEFTTPRNPDQVYDFLSDPNKFGPLLPDFQSMSVQDPTHFTVKVRVGVGNIRGTAEIKMELAEATRPLRAQYKGQGTAVGSQITLSAGFDLSPAAESTKVVWQGEANVFGKLASMAGGMLEPLGRKNIQKLIDGLQTALAGSAATPAPLIEAPVSGPTSGELSQSGTSASHPADAPGFSPMTPEQSHAGPPAAGHDPVEAPGFSPVTPGPSDNRLSAPVEAPGFSPANPDAPENTALAPDAPKPELEGTTAPAVDNKF